MALNLVNPALEVDQSVALVGSSGRLLESDYGSQINKFRDVVRFNRAPTKGWETKVGSKTTIRVLNAPTFASAPLIRWKDDQFFAKKLRSTKILIPGEARNLWAERYEHVDKSNSIFIMHSKKLVQFAQRTYKVSFPTPTVGLLTILVFLVNNVRPHLFGFDVEEKRPRDHYWHERPPTSILHRISEEAQFIGRLGKDGRLVLRT